MSGIAVGSPTWTLYSSPSCQLVMTPSKVSSRCQAPALGDGAKRQLAVSGPKKLQE
jgi:hypothetical protein